MTTAIIGTERVGSVISRRLTSGGETIRCTAATATVRT
jgi:Trk K+ transport system NAD-binding subunit